MKILKKLPLPVAGLALALAALGNLVRDDYLLLRPASCIISCVIVFSLVLKLLLCSKGCKEALNNPVVASSFATFPMALAILATYFTDKSAAKLVWLCALTINIAYILWFTLKFVKDFSIKKVFTTWFIVYVGIVACSVSAPYVGMQAMGRILFWFGLVTFVMLMFPIVYRCFVLRDLPDVAMPTMTIFAAPSALLIVGYLSSFEMKTINVVIPLLVVAAVLYLIGFVYMLLTVGKGFYPSISAYTFPLVVSAISFKMSNGFFAKLDMPISVLKAAAPVTMYIAMAIVAFVSVMYIKFMLMEEKKK